jgi:hypothetical protein
MQQLPFIQDWTVVKPLNLAHLRSTVPTAFAGYSFHAAEAALVFANEIIVVFLFPIHAGLHRAYHLFTTLIHLGECVSHGPQQRLICIDRPVACWCPNRQYTRHSHVLVAAQAGMQGTRLRR